MRVLIADAFEASGVDDLTRLGCDVTQSPELADEALVEAVGRLAPDVLVVRSTKVPAEVLTAAPLKLVVRAGAGYDNIDAAAASGLGIPVAVCAGTNSIAVAELAFGLLLALDRQIPENLAALRSGEWRKGEFAKARGLYGRTLGLIGVGGIGREMIPRAKAFGMDVVGWSRSLTPDKAAELGIKALSSPEKVAAASDAISIHLSFSDDTRRRLGSAFFTALKPGALVVNTSRWEITDPEALRTAIRTKGVRFATDVWRDEPAGSSGEYRNELVDDYGVIGTQHIGASTQQAQKAVASEVVRIVAELQHGRPIPGVVNGVRG